MIVRASNIKFHYPDAKTAVVDIKNIEIAPGQLTRIVGRNGTGKTTLLKLITGELRPTSGVIERESGCLPLYANQMAADMLAPQMTFQEHLNAFVTQKQKAEILEVLDTFDLDLVEKTRSFVGQLSGGQRQVFALCLALSGAYNLVCLDEFTSHLDEVSEAIAYRLMEQAVEVYQVAAIFVSHRPPLIGKFELLSMEPNSER